MASRELFRAISYKLAHVRGLQSRTFIVIWLKDIGVGTMSAALGSMARMVSGLQC